MTEQSIPYGTENIRLAETQELEKWKNEWVNSYLIHLEHPEFSALCPRSGYPDSGLIVIDYVPKEWIVELRAFKLYINSFRDKRISHEDAVNTIADRLYKEISPQSMRVIGDFMRRGGVKTVITVHKGDWFDFPVFNATLL